MGSSGAVRGKNSIMNYYLLLGTNFSYFHGEKKINLFLNVVASDLKSWVLKLKKYF